MPIVEFIIYLGFYGSGLVEILFFFRLVYLIVSRKINAYGTSAEDSGNGDGGQYNAIGTHEGGDGNQNSNDYDEEQGVISDGDSDGSTGSDGGERCLICLEQMPDDAPGGGGMWRRLRATILIEGMTRDAGQTCRRLQGCGHVFHAVCINEWLKRSRTCPSCRTPAKFSRLLSDDPDDSSRIILYCFLLNFALSYFVQDA